MRETIATAEYITQTDLLQREGWTLTIVKKLNFQPDLIKHNYLYGKRPQIKLFLIKNIEAIEKSYEFQQYKKLVLRRKASAKKGVRTKTKKMLQKINTLLIEIKKINDVTDLAIKNYNQWNAQKARDVEFVSRQSVSQEFLDRISVNYIRHNLTKYDYNIQELYGKVRKQEAYDLERFLVFTEIAKAYPEFANECRRQYLQKHLSFTY